MPFFIGEIFSGGLMRDSKPRLFYGWVVVAVSFLSMNTIHHSFPLFLVSIINEFGWNRADTSLIISINFLVMGTAAPFVGMAVERFGPQKTMTFGALLLAVATFLLGKANELWHFYLLFGIIASIGISFTGVASCIPVASRWFLRRRGMVFGIIMSGLGVGTAMVTVISPLIQKVGWRNSFTILSLFPILIAPVLVVFMRLDPREKGLSPDGHSAPGEARRVTDMVVVDNNWVREEWTLGKVVKTYRFWFLLFASFFFRGIAINQVKSHQIVFATDQGYSQVFAASVYSLYGILYSAGNLMGFLSDRYGREVVGSLGLILAVSGVFALTLNRGNTTPYFLYAYSLFMGYGAGVAAPAFSAAIADLFQGKNFGGINGLMSFGSCIGSFIAPWLGGVIYDRLGTYVPSFWVVIAAFITAIILLWIAAPRKIRRVTVVSTRANREVQEPQM